MKENFNFVEKYVRGMAVEKDILHYIAAWHEEESDCELPEFLGITEEEHLSFVEDDKNLTSILNQYRAEYRRSKFKLINCEEEERKRQSA